MKDSHGQTVSINSIVSRVAATGHCEVTVLVADGDLNTVRDNLHRAAERRHLAVDIRREGRWLRITVADPATPGGDEPAATTRRRRPPARPATPTVHRLTRTTWNGVADEPPGPQLRPWILPAPDDDDDELPPPVGPIPNQRREAVSPARIAAAMNEAPPF